MAGLAGTIQTALMFSGSKWAATKCCPALLKKTKRKKTNNRRVVVWPIRTLLCVDTKTPWMHKRNKCGFIKHWKHQIIFSIIHSIKDELEVSTFTRLRLKVISFHRRWFCFNCIRCFPAVFIRVGVPIDFGLYCWCCTRDRKSLVYFFGFSIDTVIIHFAWAFSARSLYIF